MTRKHIGYFCWTITAILAGLCIGYIHHRWFYPLYFHGDSSAMQVLAKAILDEKSLLPRDFGYGNQLVFLRSSPFIALALHFGLKGYQAFIVGSSLSIAFWTFILSWFLSIHFESKSKGLLFSVALIIPFGGWDADFFLGQQSHLSNVVLSLATLVSVYQYLTKKNKFWLIISCLCLFIMSAESPMRGMLVVAPMIAALAIISNRKDFIVISASVLASLIVAYVANRLLLRTHPIIVDYFHTLTFKSTDEVFANFIRTTGETIGAISSLGIIAGGLLTKTNFLIYSASFTFILANLIFFFSKTSKIAKLSLERVSQFRFPKKGEEDRTADFIDFTAVLGVCIGMIAVACLNPDSSRHYIWAMVALKFCLFTMLYKQISNLATEKIARVSIIAICLILSFWLANLLVHNWSTSDAIKSRNYPEVIAKIKEISTQKNIKNIYGEDFWRIMPLNVTLDDMNGGALILVNGRIDPYYWLNRPSLYCVSSPVLYYLKNGATDNVIEEKLMENGGEKVYSTNECTLWVGPPVWKTLPWAHRNAVSDCNNSQ